MITDYCDKTNPCLPRFVSSMLFSFLWLPISQTTWHLLSAVFQATVWHKREQPVSVLRSVWCYLRKVLKHARWQDERMTMKRERRGEMERWWKGVQWKHSGERKMKMTRWARKKRCEVGLIWNDNTEHILSKGGPSSHLSPWRLTLIPDLSVVWARLWSVIKKPAVEKGEKWG